MYDDGCCIRVDNEELQAAVGLVFELLKIVEEAVEAEGLDTEGFAHWQSDADTVIAKVKKDIASYARL